MILAFCCTGSSVGVGEPDTSALFARARPNPSAGRTLSRRPLRARILRPMPCHSDDVPWQAHERGALRAERRRLGRAAGARDVGLSRYRVAAGARSMPLHVRVDEEEIV